MRVVLVLTAITLGVVAVVPLAVLLARSGGTPRPLLDEHGRPIPGSISEKLRVPINGLEQGMFLEGYDRTKPVLLVLHGGPGFPEHAISHRYPSVLQQDFVVCWWEQRGAGLSFRGDARPETVTLEQLVSDTIAVTNYLRERFGQEKIYLLAHSGGTIVGARAVARAPRLYHAYIGMAQMTRQRQSETLAFRYITERYAAAGDRRMLARLARFELADDASLSSVAAWCHRGLRDKTMHALGIGTTREMRSVITGIFLPVLGNPEYSLGEKIGIWRGKWSANTKRLWNEILATDLSADVPTVDVPVYLLHGAWDYTVSYALAREYFDRLQAPRKGFYTFENSAHSPLFEEPERTRRILREDVLGGTTRLADPGTEETRQDRDRDLTTGDASPGM